MTAQVQLKPTTRARYEVALRRQILPTWAEVSLSAGSYRRWRRSAVAAGANVKAVQRMLEHTSASMRLDVYAGLIGDDLDAVATRLDEAVAARDADYCGPGWSVALLLISENDEAQVVDLGFCTEPPDGIEPSTYALRVDRCIVLGLASAGIPVPSPLLDASVPVSAT
ncbi:hypothetical protein [Micromonospora zhanjiangensis]|uniref:Phage integrase family protein n=1 Tax=Micromonospora zhanjiangensis TaxID=1522057 RepID=A0ABV8KP38_9ACTN